MSDQPQPEKRQLKYCEDLPKHNFRRKVDEYLLDGKAVALCEKAKLSSTQLSLFRSMRGGLEWHALIRLMIAMGWKIYDQKGELILGNPENIAQEMEDNTFKFEEPTAE